MSAYIYIAGPYSKGDCVTNTADVIRMADCLALHGHVPFVPHLTLFWHFLSPHDIEFWYQYDLAWLDKCDCLLRLPGESAGADDEVSVAIKRGKRVYFTLKDCLNGEGWGYK